MNYLFGGSKVALADVNGDGMLDIVTNGTNSLTVLLNLGDTRAVTGTLTASPEPSVMGAPFTATAMFRAVNNSQPVTGTVAFTLNGLNQPPVTLVNGSASVTLNTPILYSEQTVQLTATYSGDANYSRYTVTSQHAVIYRPVTPSIVLTATSSNPLRSRTLQILVTLSNGSKPAGGVPVHFFADGLNLGTVSTGSTGIAVLDVNTLTIGTHSIVAKTIDTAQTDNTKLVSVTSAPVTVVVSAHATVTALTLSSGNGATGAPVTLKALVSSPDSVSPFGAVSFSDGTNILSTVLLTNSLATFTTAQPASGSHAYIATFLPTESFAGSTSAAASYTANAMPGVSIPVIATQSAQVNGQVRISAQITGAANLGGRRLTLLRGWQVLGSAVTSGDGSVSVALPADVSGSGLRWINASDGDLKATLSSPVDLGAIHDSSFAIDAPGTSSLTLSETIAVRLTRTTLKTPVTWTCESDTGTVSCAVADVTPSGATLRVTETRLAGATRLWPLTALLLLLPLRRRSIRHVAPLCGLAVLSLGVSACGRALNSTSAAVLTVRATGGAATHAQQILLMRSTR